MINERTGKASGFFLEGRVNMTYTYHEVMTSPGAKSSVWDMEATDQKQHSYEPGAYEWTDLHVNRARGLYRFHPPSGKAKGTMTFTIGDGPTRQQPADFDEWYKAGDFVDDLERTFDPGSGIISGFANFTFFNVLGIKDFFGREPAWPDPDNRPPVTPSQNELPGGQKPSEAIWEAMRTLKDGTPALVQPVTYTVTWNLNLETGACQRTVRIISPEEDKEFVFGSQYNEPKNLLVPTMAEATPKSYEAGIFPWEMDDIEGSTKELKSFGPGCGGIIDDTPVKGPCVRFRFENLPKDNSQFGRKTITADIAAPVHVRVFYKKLEKTNPEGKDPNWFYYWKQGAVPRLDEFTYVQEPPSPGWGASFRPPNELSVYPLAALCSGAIKIELFERLPGFTNPYEGMGYKRGDWRGYSPIDNRGKMDALKEFKHIRLFRTIDIEELRGVDVCHALVLHELKHKWVYESFHAYTGTGGLKDTDGDWLPDHWEIWTQSQYQFKPTDPDTHFLRFQYYEGYDWVGDMEVLSFEAMKDHRADHSKDWATPGKQSQDKDECRGH